MKKLPPLFMKTIPLIIKLVVLTILLIITGALSVSAQQNRHASNTYNFAFQIPKNSAKDIASTEKEITYNEKTIVGASLGVTVDDEKDAASNISEALTSKIGKDALVDGFIEGLKEDLKTAKITILERKDLKISGINSYKIVTSIVVSDLKMRNATFFVPVTAHNRNYIFTVTALDTDFDRWYKVAEASINSFQLLKTKTLTK